MKIYKSTSPNFIVKRTRQYNRTALTMKNVKAHVRCPKNFHRCHDLIWGFLAKLCSSKEQKLGHLQKSTKMILLIPGCWSWGWTISPILHSGWRSGSILGCSSHLLFLWWSWMRSYVFIDRKCSL